jgi:tRNA 5-methylaminomethyl-2-thiouridine biosynthesis bifunctional protein
LKKAIVIGGGIAGCSTAFALANRGITVTLLERQARLGSGASGNPLAALYPKLGLSQTLADTLTMQGFAFTQQLLKSLPNTSIFFDFCGQIQLGFNAREQARQIELSQRYALPLLSAEAASEKAGIKLKVGGIYLPQSAWLKPIALCEALCMHANISVSTQLEALEIEQVAQQWRIKSANNTFEADMVVLCNANDIQQFAQTQNVEITPVRGQLDTFQQTAESTAIKTLICSDHYLSPAVDGWHVVGTTYAPNDLDANIREVDTLENLGALRAISSNIYKSVEAKHMQGRVAWRSQTRDYVPLAGQMVDSEKLREKKPRHNALPNTLPWLDGLFVNAGHGSKGMITAPICAELIACLATSQDLPVSPELAARLNPSRFLLRELGLKQIANTLYSA